MKWFGIKTINLLLCLLTVIAAACKDEEKETFTVNEDGSVGLTVSSKAIIIGKDGGTATITVSSGYYWNLYGESDWCTLSANSGNPNEPCEITIDALKNEGEGPRYATFYLRSGFDKIDVSVLQPGTKYVEPDQTGMETGMFDLIYSIPNGWNLGNAMEAWNSWDSSVLGNGESMEEAWGNPATTQELIDHVYELGFRGIRIPCKWDVYFTDMKNPASVDYKIYPNWLNRMKEVVDYCKKYPDLKVLLNTHNCDWDRACMKDSVAKYEPMVFKVWTQIAENFRDYDERLIFGAVNEPAAETTEACEVLCRYEQAFVNAVRGTGGKNAHRVLVVQAPNTNFGLSLTMMKMPVDYVADRMAVEVHYYEPSAYCILGDEDAGWGNAAYFWGKDYMQEPINGIDRNSYNNEEYVDNLFPQMKAKFVDNGIPVIVGEYGAGQKDLSYSPTLQRICDESYVYYHQYVVTRMKENGMVPFVWDPGALFDRKDPKFPFTNEEQWKGIKVGFDIPYPYVVK